MKTLELNLNKRLLIVEILEGELTAIGNDKEVFYAIKHSGDKIANGKTHKLICKGSELTEEIAKGFVFPMWGKYINYLEKDNPVGNYNRLVVETSLASFVSAVESKGYHWGENPIDKRLEFIGNVSEIDRQIALQKQERRWQEAESKTFNPEKTLIFERL